MNDLRTNEIADLFGHTLSEEEILTLYPCDTGIFKREDYDKPDLTITYDIHTATLGLRIFLLLCGEKNIRIIIEPLCFASQDQRLLCFEKGI